MSSRTVSLDFQSDPDETLLREAKQGSEDALGYLLQRHHDWIYRRVRTLIWNGQDADDITQEILLRIISRFKSFQCRCRFKSWLHRLVNNFLLNILDHLSTRDKIRILSIEALSKDGGPFDIADCSTTAVDVGLLIEEAKGRFMTGVLACLDRQQRLVFVLSDLLDATDAVGAALLDITPTNFRFVLMTARCDLREFMDNNCGLTNHKCSCRCPRKTMRYIKQGFVDRQSRLFNVKHFEKVSRHAAESILKLDEIVSGHVNTPSLGTRSSRDNRTKLKRILKSPIFCASLNLRKKAKTKST